MFSIYVVTTVLVTLDCRGSSKLYTFNEENIVAILVGDRGPLIFEYCFFVSRTSRLKIFVCNQHQMDDRFKNKDFNWNTLYFEIL